MQVKRIFKGPWLWMVLAMFGVLLAIQYLAPNGGYDEVKTSELSSWIKDGDVKEITFIDGDQEIQATLDEGTREGSDKVLTHYILGQQQGLIALVDEQVEKGTIEESNSENPQPGLLSSLLVTLLPFAADRAALHLLDEPGPGWRPRRHAVRQVQGQADHQGHAEDDVRRRRRL